ncbi:uncharacterized protein LOC100830161, partial [Brachypodium distachyon]
IWARMKKKPVVICCSVLLALIVVLAIVFISLYFTVFRPRSPHVEATVVSTRITQVEITFPPKLNLSFSVDVTVRNPNYASFRYGDVMTQLTYYGNPVGQSVVLAGEVGARTTQTVEALVVVEADKVVYTLPFIPDVLAGALPFETRTTVAGKAVVLGTLKISATSVVTCRITTNPIKQESTSECTSTARVG